MQDIRAELDPDKAPNPVTFSDLKILTKDQTLVPFEPNPIQAQYLDELCPTWRTEPIKLSRLREIILKARQFGFSTLVAVLFFLQTVNYANTKTVVMAHDAETSETLFQMVKTFWENLPDEKRPKTKYNSKRQLLWPSLNSSYQVKTAGAKGGARGLTIHNLHCSEAAFYTNPKLLTALLQCVPASGNVFIESTANGELGRGEIYCTEYRKAAGHTEQKPEERTPYTGRFFAWWQHNEYEADVDPDFKRADDETTIVNKYDLDRLYGQECVNRKLTWRRIKRAEPGMGVKFGQEYPGDDIEAFLVSADRYFTGWNNKKHVVFEDEIDYERHWTFWGAYDWGRGKGKFACFLLGVVDRRGRVIVLDEEYNTDKTNAQQAELVHAVLKRWGLDPADIVIYADPSMWGHKADHTGRRIRDVQAFFDAGLRFVQASNDRRGGWSNVCLYLHDVDIELGPDGSQRKKTPFLRILKRCANLIRTMPLQQPDKDDSNDVDTDGEDHAPDTLRYLLAARPRPSGPDPKAVQEQEARKPSWMKKEQKRKL